MKPKNIYDLDLSERLKLEDEFFAQPFLMSYSGLNKLLYSPGAFYQHYVLKQKEDTVDKAAAEGSLIHCMLLTPEKFDDQFVVLPDSFPSDNPKRVIERLHKHLSEVYPGEEITHETAIGYLESIQNAVLDILKDENLYQSLKTDSQRLDKMLTEKNMEYLMFLFKSGSRMVVEKPMVEFAQKLREEIMSKPHIRSVMGMGGEKDVHIFNELPVVCMDNPYSFGLKGIIDNLVIDHNRKVIRVNDLKKTGKALSSFPETIEYYKYWMQAAIYHMIINGIKKTSLSVDYPVEFRFIVVDPYMHIAPFKVSEDTMKEFVNKTTLALQTAEQHFKTKDFSLPVEALMSEDKEFTL